MVDGDRLEDGRLDRYIRPFDHGAGRWWSLGVVLRHNKAICGSDPLSRHYVKVFLIVCLIRSAKPFD